MRKLILVLSALLMINIVFAQADFKWEKTDSIHKTKSQIYSDTKMFIAKTWRSAKDVIQNDDKDAGIILIKGISIQKFTYALMHQAEFIYNYTVTFKMKDGKYKIILEDVYCSSAQEEVYPIKKIEPSDEIPYPLETGWISEKKARKLMESLKAELQLIVDSYVISMKSTVSASSSDDNW